MSQDEKSILIRHGQHLLAQKRFGLDGTEQIIFTSPHAPGIILPYIDPARPVLSWGASWSELSEPMFAKEEIKLVAGYGGYMGYSPRLNVLAIRPLG